MGITSLNAQQTSFAIIGDFGSGSSVETAVANLIKSWDPQFIITTGDNRYGDTDFDLTVGRDFCEYLAGAESGGYCNGNQSTINTFFPSLGNHDYLDGGGVSEYLAYFTLPGAGIQTTGTSGGELHYDFIKDHVHFFILDSEGAINEGTMTAQQTWLENQMAASTARWKIVYFHHAPYSSGSYHGSTPEMRWPFAQWGADVVICGHDHIYERLEYDGITYFVNGLGGRSRYDFSTPLSGSIFQYNAEYGAQRVVADDTSMLVSFVNVHGDIIDEQLFLKLNHPPEFVDDTLVETAAVEDSSYLNSIAERAFDPDGGNLSFSILSGPAWLSVSGNGLLSGTPRSEDVGLNSWILEVADEGFGADQTILQMTVVCANEDSVSSGIGFLEPAVSENTSKTLFIVYPVPTTDRLIVHINGGEGNKCYLTLYNISGNAVYSQSMLEKDIEIDVTPFPKGLYFLNISSEYIKQTKKILIQ